MNQRAGDPIVEEIRINASAERVFDALTNPEERVQWWGAEGSFRTTHVESDLRPGGRWAMRGLRVNGEPFAITGEYREIIRPHLLVFTWLPDWQGSIERSLVRFDLREEHGITTVRLTHSGLRAETRRTSHRGWPQILAWLQAYAEGRGATAALHRPAVG
jgi:uncharacterized protein YndB with AHSA1/START domain